MRNFSCRGTPENQAWLEAILTAQDLIARTKLLTITSEPALANYEVQTFRYPVLHAEARTTRSSVSGHKKLAIVQT